MDKPYEAVYSDYLSQMATMSTQHRKTHFIIAHSTSPSDWTDSSEVVKNRKPPIILNAQPGLVVVKNITNRCIVHPLYDRNPDFLAAPQLLQIRESCSAFTIRDVISKHLIDCNQTDEVLTIIDYY